MGMKGRDRPRAKDGQMKRILAIAGIFATTVSALGQTLGTDSYIGDTQVAMVNRWASAGLLVLRTRTLNGALEADLAKLNPIGATDPTHLDLPHTVFENQIGEAPPFMRMGSSKFQIRRTRHHSRRHHRRLRQQGE
jgi:hypothetical protein